MVWDVFWELETVLRSKCLSLAMKLRLNSLKMSVMLCGAESWPVNTQMSKFINSFGRSAYDDRS